METLVMELTRHDEMPHGALYATKRRHDSAGNLVEAWVRNDGNRADTVLKVTHKDSGAVDSWLLKPANGYKGDDMDLELFTQNGKEYLIIAAGCHEVVTTQQRGPGGALIEVQVESDDAVIANRIIKRKGLTGEAATGAGGRGTDNNAIAFERQAPGSRPLYKRVPLL